MAAVFPTPGSPSRITGMLPRSASATERRSWMVVLVGSSWFFTFSESHTESRISFDKSPSKGVDVSSITSATLASRAVYRKSLMLFFSSFFIISSCRSCLADVSDWR